MEKTVEKEMGGILGLQTGMVYAELGNDVWKQLLSLVPREWRCENRAMAGLHSWQLSLRCWTSSRGQAGSQSSGRTIGFVFQSKTSTLKHLWWFGHNLNMENKEKKRMMNIFSLRQTLHLYYTYQNLNFMWLV